jgi:hypothetical protein
MTDRYEITLLRNEKVDTSAPTRRLRAFRPMPETASSDQQASAELRRLSDEMIAERGWHALPDPWRKTFVMDR